MTTEALVPLMPTDAEIERMRKRDLLTVIASHGLPPIEKATEKQLRPYALSAVHGARTAQMIADADAEARTEEPAAPAPVGAAPVDLEPVPSHIVPEYSRFQVIQQVAAVLAKSDLTPDALRGHPTEVTHILLKANDIGVPLTTALDQIYVIKGKTGMEAKLMRTLIRRDGHVLRQPFYDGFRAIVHGTRSDTGEEAEGEFTLDDAVDFDLIAGYDKNDDDTFTVRPLVVNGKQPKPQWVKDTKNMLIERATSRLARWLFSECLGGVTYTPDELGWGVDVEVADELGGGAGPRYGRAGEPEPTMTIGQQRKELGARLSELPEDLQQGIKAEWAKRNFPKVTDLTAAAVRVVRGWVENAEATVAERDSTDDIPDADVVTEQDGEQPGPPRSGDDGVEGPVPADRDAPGPSSVEDRQEAGEPGPPSGDDGAASPPAESTPVAASPAPDAVLCAAGDGPIVDQTPVFDDGKPFHPDCAPWTEDDDDDEGSDEYG